MPLVAPPEPRPLEPAAVPTFLRAGGGGSASRQPSCIVCQPVAVSSQPDEPWYAVRCLFGFPAAEKVNYEERVTIWRAGNFEEAVAMAEREAQDYAETLDAQYLGLAQSFHLFVEDRPLEPGDEVFSLIRESILGADEYVSRFFATGGEHQKPLE